MPRIDTDKVHLFWLLLWDTPRPSSCCLKRTQTGRSRTASESRPIFRPFQGFIDLSLFIFILEDKLHSRSPRTSDTPRPQMYSVHGLPRTQLLLKPALLTPALLNPLPQSCRLPGSTARPAQSHSSPKASLKIKSTASDPTL